MRWQKQAGWKNKKKIKKEGGVRKNMRDDEKIRG